MGKFSDKAFDLTTVWTKNQVWDWKRLKVNGKYHNSAYQTIYS